jgi:hypothetical protein
VVSAGLSELRPSRLQPAVISTFSDPPWKRLPRNRWGSRGS